MPRIVMSTFGSLGDLFPYLAIGRELRRRGHTVVVATFAAYRSRVEAEGLDFHAARPDIDPTDPRELQRALDPRHGGEYILRDVAFGHLGESFEDCRAAARGADLIVTHPMAFGMLLFARASRQPWASVALAPVSLFSTLDPPVYAGLPFGDGFARLGPPFQRALHWMLDRGTRRWQATYRLLETELSLPAGPNPVLAGQHSPHLVLGLFSPLLAAPQPDWPAAARAVGFPFYDSGAVLDPRIERFLDAGPAPVVFTLGSAAVGAAGNFYAESATAIARLGVRALMLVGSGPANAVATSPDVVAVPYAPHAAVFPRASVIVHQGGIGTTGEAMRAGRPMLVVPYGHDQPDHARRLCRLGVARSIPRSRYDARRARHALAALLADPTAAERAASVGARVASEHGLAAACDALEALLPGPPSSRSTTSP